MNDTTRMVIDGSKVTIKIVASHADNSRSIIYIHNMFIVQATAGKTEKDDPIFFSKIEI